MKRLFSKKNLMILGIILVLIGIPLTIFILKNQTVLKSRASDTTEPRDVKITNITSLSFTVTYQTELPSTGSISYGSDKKLGESELEDIDKEKGSFSPKKIHSISVKKLIPATKYYLTIISGSNTFLNNGAPFEAITGPDISSTSGKQQDIKGKIVLPDGSAPPEALVYLNAENSQLLSSTTTKDGEFSFSLKELRTNDFSSYFDINEDTVFKIVATNGSLKSTVLTSLNQKNSIPTITLSNDYNFIQESSSVASKSAESSGFPSTIDLGKKSKPEIINPKENQSFPDQKPQFRGTSLPNEKVEIIIHSEEEIVAQVTADSNGNWIYKPSTNLSPGAHTITIKTRDSQGILTTIMQSFTVFAAETQTS
ncbi:MAG: Ig-like domain-containing protein, partial [Candidatus Levybacteria bacterium]|nr:Ig-like domain-containing protein [Candidatus Levybacteria bacterium]